MTEIEQDAPIGDLPGYVKAAISSTAKLEGSNPLAERAVIDTIHTPEAQRKIHGGGG